MRRSLVVAALFALLPATASAESPRWGSFDFAVGPYRPDVDSEDFPTPPAGSTAGGPLEDTFGSKRGWMFRVSVARALFIQAGSLEAGFQTGFFNLGGKGRYADTNLQSLDKTKFRFIPTSLFLNYRFDLLADRYKIPLAPYARVAFERYNWWVTDGNGDTSEYGATNGWSVAGGVALLLDILDPGMARELDNDNGVNHTYLFAEVRRAQVDDFGSSRSWDLSDTAFSGGLMFVF